MNTTITVQRIETAGNHADYHAAVRLAMRLLIAKLTQDKRNKKLCVCLERIGDNGPCPVHGKGA